MSVLGTGIAAGVAQTAQQAEQVAGRKDKKARDKRAQADSLELHALGQEKVDEVDQPEAASADEPVGIATDNERGDKPTDQPPPEPAPIDHDARASHAHPPSDEPIARAEAAASYEHAEAPHPSNDHPDDAAPADARSHLDIQA